MNTCSHAHHTGAVVCLRCFAATHPRAHTSERPRRSRRRRVDRTISPRFLAKRLTDIGLQAVVVDEVAPILRCLCPACGSGSDGTCRSLLVDGRRGLTWLCENGCGHEEVVAAFRRRVAAERSSHVA